MAALDARKAAIFLVEATPVSDIGCQSWIEAVAAGIALASLGYQVARDYVGRRRCVHCGSSKGFSPVPALTPDGYWLGFWYDACNNCRALNPHER